MNKPWWQYLLEIFASVFTQQQIEEVAQHRIDSARVVAVGPIDLPTFGESVPMQEERERAELVAFFRKHLGDKYRLGVEVPAGGEDEAHVWDCSESTEAAYRLVGKHLPDGAQNQKMYCHPVRAPRAGDLGFLWSDKRVMIGHVFMATGEGTVVHAVGGRGVVEDPMSMWEQHERFRGWGRHPDYARPKEDRA